MITIVIISIFYIYCLYIYIHNIINVNNIKLNFITRRLFVKEYFHCGTILNQSNNARYRI